MRTGVATVAGALVLVVAAAHAAEPPAYARPPEPAAKRIEPRLFMFEGAMQEAWSTMGGWHDGIADLESRARQSGLLVTTSNNPAYSSSFEAAVLVTAPRRLFVGIQYDRLTGKSEFTVRENTGMGGGTAEYKTAAEAASNAWLLVGRWMIPGERRGVRPFIQLGAGVGSARLEFSTPGGAAQGKGHAFAGSAEAGLHVGDGAVRVSAAAGYRAHRVPLGYSRVRAGSQPGVQRYYFDYNDEIATFVNGRDVQLGGAFARLGLAVVRTR